MVGSEKKQTKTITKNNFKPWNKSWWGKLMLGCASC